MSDQTPVETAAEAISQPIPDINRLSHHEIQQWLARTALASLAQHHWDDLVAEFHRHAVVHSYPSEDSTRYVFECRCGAMDIDSLTEHSIDAFLAYLTGGPR